MKLTLRRAAIRSAAAVINSWDIGQVFGDDLCSEGEDSDVQDLHDLKDEIVKHIERMLRDR